MTNTPRKSRLILFGLGLVIVIAAVAFFLTSDQFRPQASTVLNRASTIFGNSAVACTMQKVSNAANAKIYIQDGVAYDGSVSLGGAWHPRLYQVLSDDSLTALTTNNLCLGIIQPPTAMSTMFRFYNKQVFNGAVRMTVAPGDRFRIKFDDQPYCTAIDFTIPNDFTTTKKNQIRDIVVAPAELKTVQGLRPSDTPPSIGTDSIYIPIDYMQCNRYTPDKEAREYTGILYPTQVKEGLSPAYPYTFIIDDENSAYDPGGGGGSYLVSTFVGTTLERNTALEVQLRKILEEHPPSSPKVGRQPVYYITVKGKLGPEIKVGSNQTSVTQRYLQIESVVATDIQSYTETHSGMLVVEPNPSSYTGSKYRLIDNTPPQPYQSLHYIIPKTAEIDTQLKAMVGKNVTVTGRRSPLGMPWLDTMTAQLMTASN